VEEICRERRNSTEEFLKTGETGEGGLVSTESWVLQSESLECSASLNMRAAYCKGPLIDRRLEATDASS
jgi:hypothetical protein